MIRSLSAFAVLLVAGHSVAGEPPESTWSHQVGTQIWSQPAHDGGVIYLGADDGGLHAIDARAGTGQAVFHAGARIRSGITIAEGLVLFASDDGSLYALDRETHKERWRFDLGGAGLARRLPAVDAPYTYDYAHSSPVVHEGMVYIGSADQNVYAVDLESGELGWKFATQGMVRATPLVTGDLVCVGSWDGTLYALRLEDGEPAWTFDAGGPVTTGAASGAGRVVFGSRSARVFALDGGSGESVWEFTHSDGSWVESTPVIEDGVVYIGSSDALRLYALDLESGAEQWVFRTGGWSWGAPLVLDDAVCIGAISAHPYYMPGIELQRGLFAVDRTSGEYRWQANRDSPSVDGYITGGVYSTPVIAGDLLVIAGVDGVVTAVRR